MKRIVMTALCFLLLVGCTGGGGFQTSKLNTITWTLSNPVNGVIYYEPQMVRIRYEYTAITNEFGKIVGTSSEGKCQPCIQREEISIQPNFNTPRVLTFNPPFLSSGQFGLTMNNGMITSINAQATSTAVETAAAAVGGAVGAAAKSSAMFLSKPGAKETEIPLCNSEPIITSIVKQEVPWTRDLKRYYRKQFETK